MLVSLLPPVISCSSSHVLPLLLLLVLFLHLLLLLLFLAGLYKSLLLQSAPLALPSSSYFFFPFIFHAAKANACIMRGTGLLAVPSESNDLRERPSNRSTVEKGAGATGEAAYSTLSFLRKRVHVSRNGNHFDFRQILFVATLVSPRL